jgi:hypothetical protein
MEAVLRGSALRAERSIADLLQTPQPHLAAVDFAARSQLNSKEISHFVHGTPFAPPVPELRDCNLRSERRIHNECGSIS